MHRFVFRLEGLLRIRRHVEEQCELVLAEVSGRCVRLERSMRDLAAERVGHLACSLDGMLMDFEELRSRTLYLRRLDRDLERARAERARLEVERTKAQAAYFKASRDRKVLDRLKERRSGEYYKKQLYEDSKVLDEVGQNMHGRAKVEE